MAPAKRSCEHREIQTSVSAHASEAGFERPSPGRLAAATTWHGRVDKATTDGVRAADPLVFPAPLVLPDDALAIDPKYPPQSLRSWMPLASNSLVTPQRRTLYFAAAPEVAPEVSFVDDWRSPRATAMHKTAGVSAPPPSMATDVLEYLKAFYHGLPVKMFPGPLRFVEWPDKSKSKSRSKPKVRSLRDRPEKAPSDAPARIGLEFGGAVTGITTRASPHEKRPVFARQLNLNDLLDAAIDMLPADACALLLLVDHDIYEDAEDEFACGRAYGGSRIAVVSAARYNPGLKVDGRPLRFVHDWPLSHCAAYVKAVLADAELDERPVKKQRTEAVSWTDAEHSESPMAKAFAAYVDGMGKQQAPNATRTAQLWMARVCKTASHELGHCLCIDHCSYYACIMQGTAGLLEDHRQPPYLCPVDLAKVLKATGASERRRYEAHLELFDRDGWKEEPMFAAYAAWIRALPIMQRSPEPAEVIVID